MNLSDILNFAGAVFVSIGFALWAAESVVTERAGWAVFGTLMTLFMVLIALVYAIKIWGGP